MLFAAARNVANGTSAKSGDVRFSAASDGEADIKRF
jgi:hypothetical protein